MKKPLIDCLLIGHNDMDFREYEQTVKKMGSYSGAYRDLNHNFICYQGKPYTASEIFNLFYRGHRAIRQGETFSAAIAYLGTYLDRRGYSFDYIHSFREQKEELAEKLMSGNILTIAVTTTLYVSPLPIIEIIRFIKQYNQTAKIIVGGPFVSSQIRTQDRMVVKYLFETMIGADVYVISSQGEATLVKVLDSLKKSSPLENISNIYHKTANGYVTTPSLQEDNKLSENMVNWDLFSHSVGEYVNLRTSISCPFNCAFCGFPQHAGKYQTAPIEAIEAELDSLNRVGTVKSVQFIDDTFNVPLKRFKEILRMLTRKKYNFKWHSHFRCQFADRETVELMKESGCEGVFLGIESGSDQVLENMNKSVSTDKYLGGISILSELGIPTLGSFIIGFPGETEETVQDTLRFIEESGIDFFQVQLWYCEPITPIWKKKEIYNIKGSHYEWRHKTMDSKTAANLADEIFISVEKSVSIPRYNFDSDQLFHLTHRGISLEGAKTFLRIFNNGIKEKLSSPLQRDVSPGIVKQFREFFRGQE